jgi:Family of unknown function (DUF5681)
VAWQKGQSGNPGGNLKEKPITDKLRLALKQNDEKALDAMIRNIVSQAMAGTPWAVEFVTDRLEGKAVQQLESNTTIEHRYVRAPSKMTTDAWKQHLLTKTATVSGKPSQDRKVN